MEVGEPRKPRKPCIYRFLSVKLGPLPFQHGSCVGFLQFQRMTWTNSSEFCWGLRRHVTISQFHRIAEKGRERDSRRKRIVDIPMLPSTTTALREPKEGNLAFRQTFLLGPQDHSHVVCSRSCVLGVASSRK